MPRVLVGLTGQEQTLYHLGRVAQHLDAPDLLAYFDELKTDESLLRALETQVADEPAFTTKRFGSVFELRLFRILLYCLVRHLKPDVAVETGVLHGLTTAFLLDALVRNGSGALVSIDLPAYAGAAPPNRDGYDANLPPDREPGWAIPPALHGPWELCLGPSDRLLPEVLGRHAAIDLFLHDSEHTYETMELEMGLAWPALRPGGVMVVDNFDANGAFDDFCAAHGVEPVLLPAPDELYAQTLRFGLVVKP
jgi:predicted O-methyltransferase YrrM